MHGVNHIFADFGPILRPSGLEGEGKGKGARVTHGFTWGLRAQKSHFFLLAVLGPGGMSRDRGKPHGLTELT